MAPRRKVKGKKAHTESRPHAGSLLSESSSIIMDPMAASSPTRDKPEENLTNSQILEAAKAKLDAFKDNITRLFNEALMSKLENDMPEMLDMDEDKFVACLIKAEKEDDELESQSTNENQHLSQPSTSQLNFPSTSGASTSTTANHSDNKTSNGLKSILKTPASSKLNSIAGTPGRNKSIVMKRFPAPGETAVSLAGSPLLVWNPCEAIANDTVTLQIPDPASGKIMALLKDSSGNIVDNIDECLNKDTKHKIRDFAKYLTEISSKFQD